MIIKDLDEFMKRNGIDTETEERSSKEKPERLQGMVPLPKKNDKYMFEPPSESAGSQKSKSRKKRTFDDFDFDFPKRRK